MRFMQIISGFLISSCIMANPLVAAELEFSTVEGVGGIPLNVVQTGNRDGFGILLIHGFGQGALAFKNQLHSDLAEEFHVVAFDMRGHATSGKPWRREDLVGSEIWGGDVAKVVEATNIKRPVLVGWSFGGFVAIDYLRHYGVDSVAGINLVGSHGGLMPRPIFGSGRQMTDAIKKVLDNSRMSRSLDPVDNITAARLTAQGFYTPNMKAADKEEQFAFGIMMPSYVRRAMMGRDLNNTDFVSKLTAPVLLTRGDSDLVISQQDAEKLVGLLPDGDIAYYANTGHLPFFSHPERYNKELAAFTRRVNKPQ